jgi:glycosyltransferase involved in cell wall biosynthesis
MSIKISVIVPVYNTEKYLKKCLDSILNQTFKEFDLIVINDGSTDGSLDILKSYQEKFPNIIIIDKKNEGQGVARNKALEICKGEFIAFVDSDDYLELDMLELMYDRAICEKLDIVICNYRFVNSIGEKIQENNVILQNSEVVDNFEAVKRFLVSNTIEGFSCNKLFRRNVLKDIKYPEDMKFEDIPTVMELIINADRIGFVNKELYNYLLREDSTSATRTSKNTLDYIKAIYMVGDILKKSKFNNLEKEYEYYFTRAINQIYAFLRASKNKDEKAKITSYSKKYINSIKKYRILFCNEYSKKIDIIKMISKIYLIKFYLK